MYKFDFDEWAELYQRDPEEFERRRQEVLEAEIQKAPVENRSSLRIIQMECDALHNTLPPLEAAAAMSQMMAARLQQMKTPLTQLRSIVEDLDSE